MVAPPGLSDSRHRQRGHMQDLDGLLHLYKRHEKPGRVPLLCLLCAKAGWLILVTAWLRLERAYLKLRLFLHA
jgi:hypothetical protein